MEGMSMFVQLQEKRVENDRLVFQSMRNRFVRNHARKTDRELLQETEIVTSNIARLSEKSISLIDNTLNRLFTQGLLNKFHSKQMKNIAILTKNLRVEIQQCIQAVNNTYDVQVLHINEMLENDLKVDLIIALDFNFEMILFNDIYELTKELNIPWIQFGIADDNLYMGPIFLERSQVD